jgi:hypothetical protein
MRKLSSFLTEAINLDSIGGGDSAEIAADEPDSEPSNQQIKTGTAVEAAREREEKKKKLQSEIEVGGRQIAVIQHLRIVLPVFVTCVFSSLHIFRTNSHVPMKQTTPCSPYSKVPHAHVAHDSTLTKHTLQHIPLVMHTHTHMRTYLRPGAQGSPSLRRSRRTVRSKGAKR